MRASDSKCGAACLRMQQLDVRVTSPPQSGKRWLTIPWSFRDGALAPDPESRCTHKAAFWIPGSSAISAFARVFDALWRTPRNDCREDGPIHFSISQSSAALFLCGAGYAVVFGKIRIAQKKNRGRAGRQGSNWTRGPRRLATASACLSLWFEAGRRGLHSERLFMMARTLATL